MIAYALCSETICIVQYSAISMEYRSKRRRRVRTTSPCRTDDAVKMYPGDGHLGKTPGIHRHRRGRTVFCSSSTKPPIIPFQTSRNARFTNGQKAPPCHSKKQKKGSNLPARNDGREKEIISSPPPSQYDTHAPSSPRRTGDSPSSSLPTQTLPFQTLHLTSLGFSNRDCLLDIPHYGSIGQFFYLDVLGA